MQSMLRALVRYTDVANVARHRRIVMCQEGRDEVKTGSPAKT